MPDGRVVSFPENMSPADITAAIKSASAPAPPPGVMVHDVNRSYITGGTDPAERPPPYVDTTNMTQQQRQEAAAALALRQQGGSGAILPRQAVPLSQGFSLNFGDELMSAGAAAAANLRHGAPFGETYNTMQEAQRQDLAQSRAEYPVGSALSQAGGALLSVPGLTQLGRMGLGAAGRLLGFGAPAAPVVAPAAVAPSLGRLIAGGALTGAGYGAAQGFGEGSGLEERLKDMGIGVGTGAAIGAAAPVVGELGRAGVNKALDAYRVGRAYTGLGLGRPAGDAVTRALAADDAFAGGVGAQNIARAGPEGMLADAGPSTTGALDYVVQRGGPGTLVAGQAIRQRGEEANQALTGALDQTLGAPQGVNAMVTNIRQGSAAARDAAYNAAYAAPIDYAAPAARDLENLLGRVPSKAIIKANELMQLEGQQSQQILANIAQDGTVTYTRMPDVRQVDYITRALRHLAESGEDAGKLGGRTDFSRAYTNLSRDIRGVTSDLVPEYGTALNTAADAISRGQATRIGYDMLKAGTGRDEVVAAVDRMSNPELEAVRQGVRSHIDDLMANVKAAASDPNQDAREAIRALNQLNSRAARDKLSTVLDPIQLASLNREIQRATAGAQLVANTATNSKTAGRLAVGEAMKEMQAPGVMGQMAEGGGLPTLYRTTMRYIFGGTPQDKLRAADEVNRQVAEILTARYGNRGPQSILPILQGAYQAQPQNAAIAAQVGAAPGRVVPGVLAPEDQFLPDPRQRRSPF